MYKVSWQTVTDVQEGCQIKTFTFTFFTYPLTLEIGGSPQLTSWPEKDRHLKGKWREKKDRKNNNEKKEERGFELLMVWHSLQDEGQGTGSQQSLGGEHSILSPLWGRWIYPVVCSTSESLWNEFDLILLYRVSSGRLTCAVIHCWSCRERFHHIYT